MMNKLFRLPWTLIKIGLVIGLVIGLAYAGTCVYANRSIVGCDSGASVPAQDKALYRVTITTTGQYLYTNKLTDIDGVVTLDGYYELRDGKYRHNKSTLVLNEKYFGNIIVEVNK